jgi:trimeric autotransporter adhesin
MFANVRRRLIIWFSLMTLAAFSGEMVIAEEAKGHWDSQFRLPPGVNGPVFATLAVGNELFVGGAFTKAGQIESRGVAKWNGTAWSPLGEGIDGSVYALVESSGSILAGGTFSKAGKTEARNIAKWNGTAWEPLGAGVQDANFGWSGVGALYVQGTNLFAGGSFNRAGGIPALNVARWDGIEWHAMDTGVFLPGSGYPSGQVLAITGDGNNVYVGGIFVQAGSVGATNIARWNGSSWESIGSSFGGKYSIQNQGEVLPGRVEALAMQNGFLYAGGDFAGMGSVDAANFARWNGADWENIGNVNGLVTSLEAQAEKLYVAGNFSQAGGIQAANLAIRTASGWTARNVDLHGKEFLTTTPETPFGLIVGGEFAWAGGASAGNIARWTGESWSTLEPGTGNSLGAAPSSIASDGTNVYVAGMFWTAGTNNANGLAKWDGTRWEGLGHPAFGSDAKVVAIGSKLYYSGSFTIPEIGVTNLACWNGSQWTAVGNPPLHFWLIEAMAAVEDKLYVSGTISQPAAENLHSCFEWDGTNWNSLPWLAGAWDRLATDQTHLYIARPTGGGDVNVGRLDGNKMQPVGKTLPLHSASAFGASGAKVYVAGQTTDGPPALFVWDGAEWQNLALPKATFVSALLPVRENLYLAGFFRGVAGTETNNIIKWTGERWEPLGSGLSSTAGQWIDMVSLTSIGRKIFVAGAFTRAGDYESGNFAVWNEAPEIRLGNVHAGAADVRAFTIFGVSGDQVEIQASEGLSDWNTIATLRLNADQGQFSETANETRFYRARLVE